MNTKLSFMGTKITKISVTNDKISGRGGLSLILRHNIEGTNLYSVTISTLTPNVFSKRLRV